MKRSVPNSFTLAKCFFLAVAALLSLGSFAQTVTIVPTGTPTNPNLIPVNNSVTFSIDPIGFGSCMNNLTYSWAILNAKKDTVYKSTASSPNYNFTKEDVYTVTVTVKTQPGGSCSGNLTKTATSTIQIKKEGKDGAPKPTMFSSNALGTLISAYAMDDNGQILSGPYDYFDPFPADNAITAALSMDDKGNFFYLPTFMNGINPMTATPIAMAGVVEVWAVDKNGDHPPVVIAHFDMNGASNTELGLYRMGLDDKGNAWILAGDGNKMYATTFKTDGTKVIKTPDIKTYTVPFTSGSAADFQSGDLAFDNNSKMYVLAGSSSGTNIYTMNTNSATPTLSKIWKVTDAAGKNFSVPVTGTVFDAKGNMYFSSLDGLYFINYSAVNPTTGIAVVKKISDNFGLMDLATSQFPTSWIAPFDGVLLPVKLVQFNGAATAKNVILNWTVAANESGSRFEIEKSDNGAGFKTLASILATDKQGEEAYSFADGAPLTGKVFYRLKMVGRDESVTYSNILFFGGQAKQSSLTLLQNPVQSAISFAYSAAEATPAEISVYTSAGVKLLSQKQNLQKGINGMTLPLSNSLLKGLYLLEVKEGVNSQTVKFVRQ